MDDILNSCHSYNIMNTIVPPPPPPPPPSPPTTTTETTTPRQPPTALSPKRQVLWKKTLC